MGGKHLQPGERFGSLILDEKTHKTSRSGRVRSHWLCLCDCGNQCEVDSGNLRNGNTTRCPLCATRERGRRFAAMATHGKSRSRIYNIWCKVKERVMNPDSPRYPDYGGRGIDMCPKWAESFEAFYADMGEPPTAVHQIERVENDKGYWPDNCVWANRREQAANKRNNVVISARGETKILAEWSRETGLKERTIANRLKHGWSPNDALFTPLNGTRRKFVWRTPDGDFGTITEAARHYDIPLRTASSRFAAQTFPDWKREAL